jgi:alanine racemase
MPSSPTSKILFKQLPQIAGGHLLNLAIDNPISDLITDSRKANPAKNSVFFAISGKHHDGHNFIARLHAGGCRQFVIEREIDWKPYSDSNFLLVSDTLKALQQIVKARRESFSIPVIGITGSNGKTIVKEWLDQLLSPEYRIVKNPGSYNSQLGVPLSVWQMGGEHTLGIFEAGISKPGEMKNLADVIQPTIGIFTNVLAAHDEGFESRSQKAQEKAQLFRESTAVVYCKDQKVVDEALQKAKSNKQKLFAWSFSSGSDVQVTKTDSRNYLVSHGGNTVTLEKDFTDSASWENLMHCVATMIYMGYPLSQIKSRVAQLKALPMRLEMKAGVNGSTIIDDSYSNDLTSLSIALDFFDSQRSGSGLVILSDMLESGLKAEEWIDRINTLLSQHKIDKLIAIGPVLSKNRSRLTIPNQVFESVEDCLKNFADSELAQTTVLIKGARSFQLERLVNRFQRKIHGTVMEIDLNAIAHNLGVFRSRLNPQTKIMAMVKAFAYGSGSNEVASVLQYHKVDYLGVAYADEGKWLRSRGIHLPIMVMNPALENLQTLIDFNLEPSVYSLSLMRSLINHIREAEIKIHLKLDTGMHRLGFEEEEMDELVKLLNVNPNIKVNSIYSHLAGSDESTHDEFSAQQVGQFNRMLEKLSIAIIYPVIKHILNSAGISRLSQYQFDMVRLGIGLYGVDPGNELSNQLVPAVTLRTTISQIKTIKKNETVGYGRHGKSETEMKIATLTIGYADGFSRAFSKGMGKVWVKGKLAPVVGNVCMDMTMVDVTGLDVAEGDEVIVFGKELPVNEVAGWIKTIPYEILTSTSDRVKRVFFAESV